MDSSQDTPLRVGCPIRTSLDHSLLAAPQGFSQRATSFIASWRQGIHQMPFSRSPQPASSSPRTAPKRAAAKPSTIRPRPASHRHTHTHTHTHTHMTLLTRTSPAPPRRVAVRPQAVPRAPRAPQPRFTSQRSPRHPAAPARSSERQAATGIPEPPAATHAAPPGDAASGDAASGDDRDRTGDPLLAKQVLSQLSYAPQRPEPPTIRNDGPGATMGQGRRWARGDDGPGATMGQGGLEPPTPRLSSVCSNQLSY